MTAAATAADKIKQLREASGAGIMDCRKALEEAGGDLEKASLLLRERGAAKLAGKSARKAEEGVIMAYVHQGGKLAALVELNCETDFVGRNEEFVGLARELAMQIAATTPRWVARADVPESAITAQQAEFAGQAADLGKPVDAFVKERMEQWIAQMVLLEQTYIRDAAVTVATLVTDRTAKFGERVRVKRFVVFKLGEAPEDGTVPAAG